MQSLWNEEQARAAVERYGAQGVSEDLALRTYSARLLGAEPRLVLHGGGNTSVKTRARDVFGEDVEVLCVKGSGWDLGAIEPPGHPAVRLAPLMRLRALDRLSDEDMVSAQRQLLLDPGAPNPSVETLLHAFIAEKFVDHTHSTAVLSLANQPDGQALFEELFGGKVTCVPYVMPGFDLAKAAGAAYDANPAAEGMVLLQHGVFTWAATARESYERMIALVSTAERYIAQRGRRVSSGAAPPAAAAAAEVLPLLRGALARLAGESWPGRWLLDLRNGELARAVVDDARLADWASRGVATPDHVIRTKRYPLVAPPVGADLVTWREAVDAAMAAYGADYRAYFDRNNRRCGGAKTQLDPLPRLIAVPGLGLVGVGKTATDAAVAGDIAESWAETLLDAEAVGRFQPVGEADIFDMEYWSLEQAKLSKAAEKRLARQVAVVTGGGGAIGAAIARAFAAEGCEVAVLDLDAAAAERTARAIGGRALAIGCDVTDASAIAGGFGQIVRRFGGVDILVSNAGAAMTGAMADLPDETLRRSFELNFFAHQEAAKAAVKVMRAQNSNGGGTGGSLLFNVSKQAINPGPDFGAYGTSKAALLALVRQYALELGAEGIRCNGVNADRIRSGLLTDAMIQARAASRRLSPEAYMSGNLLGREVTARDVAQAFVFAALMDKTTGAVLPVDGGNVAAMLR
jgi:rhamnose utilization protein RhaD (predicted bifunctional aldolase and dehydrogenase)/NAD(P)-dependent dehydrogenase (short-subunit alcohol dehydrogenase family)